MASWRGLRGVLGRFRRAAAELEPGTFGSFLRHRFHIAAERLKNRQRFRRHPLVSATDPAHADAKADAVNALIADDGASSLIVSGPLDADLRAKLALVPKSLPRAANPKAKSSAARADIVLSMDAVATLGDDAALDAHLRGLFDASKRLVVIFGRNFEQSEVREGRRDRKFNDWVRLHRPDFILVSRVQGAALGLIENPRPNAPDGTYADFYIYRRLDAQTYEDRPPALAPLSKEAEEAHRAYGTLRFDIATVIYNDDLPLLRVQARSIAQNFADAMVGSIIYCVNEKKPDHCETFIQRTVVPLLGVHRDKVRILRVGDLGPSGSDGWLTQQACKLAATELCTSDFYLVLDAKHHFLRPVSHDDVFSEGRARKLLTRARGDQKPWLMASLAYFGADPKEADRPSPASAPPFMMHVESTRRMSAEIMEREGKNLAAWFCEKTDQTTEFTLYYAYLVARGLRDKLLVNTRKTTASMRIIMSMDQLRDELKLPSVWCFTIHRRRLSKLSAEDRYFVIQTWMRAGLFATEAEAFEEISRLKHHFAILRNKEDKRRAMAGERAKRTAEGA